MARPTALDDLLGKRIIDAIRRGGTRHDAALAAGISICTMFRWLQKGRAGQEPYDKFSDRVKAAEAEYRLECVQVITEAAHGGSWQAAAWYLERRNYKVWGRKDTWRAPDLPDQIKGMTREQIREVYLQKMGAVLDSDPQLGEQLVALASSKKVVNE